jgi:hypothetical protein
MISSYRKDFPWIKWPKFARFPKNFFQWVAKNVEVFCFFLLSYLVCSQIWLNHIWVDCHFSYITKLEKKKKKPLFPINVSHLFLFFCQFSDVTKVAIICRKDFSQICYKLNMKIIFFQHPSIILATYVVGSCIKIWGFFLKFWSNSGY